MFSYSVVSTPEGVAVKFTWLCPCRRRLLYSSSLSSFFQAVYFTSSVCTVAPDTSCGYTRMSHMSNLVRSSFASTIPCHAHSVLHMSTSVHIFRYAIALKFIIGLVSGVMFFAGSNLKVTPLYTLAVVSWVLICAR